MKLRNRQDTISEILRIKKALKITSSEKLQKDYYKYLKKLSNELKQYDGTIYVQSESKRKFIK